MKRRNFLLGTAALLTGCATERLAQNIAPCPEGDGYRDCRSLRAVGLITVAIRVIVWHTLNEAPAEAAHNDVDIQTLRAAARKIGDAGPWLDTDIFEAVQIGMNRLARQGGIFQSFAKKIAGMAGVPDLKFLLDTLSGVSVGVAMTKDIKRIVEDVLADRMTAAVALGHFETRMEADHAALKKLL